MNARQPVATEGIVVKPHGQAVKYQWKETKELKLLRQTKTDPLTGLLNLEGIRSSIGRELLRKKPAFCL